MKVKKISKITNIVTKVLLVATVLVLGNNTVFGADDPLSVIKNLQDFIFSIIQAVGIILVAWGIVQVDREIYWKLCLMYMAEVLVKMQSPLILRTLIIM